MRRSCLLLSLLAFACASEDSSGEIFGTAPNGSASVTVSGTLSGGTDTDMESDGDTESDDTTTSGSDTTGGTSSGSGSTGEPTTGVSTTAPTTSVSTTAAESGDTTDSGNGMGQPVDGMYSHCTAAVNTCDPMPASCIEITGTDNGFCTVSGCTNAAVDCDPTPGGSTAPPICIQAEDAAMALVQFCALDCSAAQLCPTGMVCVPNVMFGAALPVYSICV